jgi:hypothetical protein
MSLNTVSAFSVTPLDRPILCDKESSMEWITVLPKYEGAVLTCWMKK